MSYFLGLAHSTCDFKLVHLVLNCVSAGETRFIERYENAVVVYFTTYFISSFGKGFKCLKETSEGVNRAKSSWYFQYRSSLIPLSVYDDCENSLNK